MSTDAVTWVWFAAGLGLIAVELFVPHLVTGFLGLGAILVAVLRWVGVLEGPTASIVVWMISSLVLLAGLRHFVRRLFPSDRSFQSTDEDFEAAGKIVEVVHQVSSSDQNGRVRFGGTSWPAVTRQGVIEPGRKAKLVLRDNLVWIVEPVPEIEES